MFETETRHSINAVKSEMKPRTSKSGKTDLEYQNTSRQHFYIFKVEPHLNNSIT